MGLGLVMLAVLSVVGVCAKTTVSLDAQQPAYCTEPVIDFAKGFLESFKRRQLRQRNPAPVIEIARQGLISALDARFPLPEYIPDPFPFPKLTLADYLVEDPGDCQLEWSAEVLDGRYHTYFRPGDWCQVRHGSDLVLLKKRSRLAMEEEPTTTCGAEETASNSAPQVATVESTTSTSTSSVSWVLSSRDSAVGDQGPEKRQLVLTAAFPASTTTRTALSFRVRVDEWGEAAAVSPTRPASLDLTHHLFLDLDEPHAIRVVSNSA